MPLPCLPAPSRRAFVAGSVAAGLTAATRAAAQPSPVLRVGCTATDDFASAYYASDLGYFQSAGLNVQVQTFTSGAAAADAVIGGSLDIAVTTPLLLANGYLKGVPFAIIAGGAISTAAAPTSALCVAKDGPIRSAQDLAGKTIGLNVLKTVLELSLDAYLAAHRMKPSDVRTVEMAFSAQAPALERGTISAALLTEPALAVALQRGTIRSLAAPYPYIAREFLLAAWFTSRGFAQRNPALVRRFADVVYRTARWANTHHDESAAILAKYSQIPLEVLRSMDRARLAERMDPRDMQALIDAGVRYGFLGRTVPASALIFAS